MSRWDASPCSESRESWDSSAPWLANTGGTVFSWVNRIPAVMPKKAASIPNFLIRRLVEFLIVVSTLTGPISREA